MEQKDLDKSKIDILRDAIKDASDSIKHTERKIQYALTLGFYIVAGNASIITYFIGDIDKAKTIFLIFVTASLTIFSITLNAIVLKMDLKRDDLFDSINDKLFGNNVYAPSYKFTLIGKPINKLDLNTLIDNFESCTSCENDLKKVLLKELAFVSYVKEMKVKYFQFGIYIMLFSFLVTEITIIYITNTFKFT